MNYSITFSSQTGNTALLAQAIQDYLSTYPFVNSSIEECDFLFIGFWTDKGSCSQETIDFLETISYKKIFLFGTAGFGDHLEYFDQILNHVQSHINNTNQIVEAYMCQGKMPQHIRDHYIYMAKNNPERFVPLIENFDRAQNHPNEDDITLLIQTLESIIKDSF